MFSQLLEKRVQQGSVRCHKGIEGSQLGLIRASLRGHRHGMSLLGGVPPGLLPHGLRQPRPFLGHPPPSRMGNPTCRGVGRFHLPTHKRLDRPTSWLLRFRNKGSQNLLSNLCSTANKILRVAVQSVTPLNYTHSIVGFQVISLLT